MTPSLPASRTSSRATSSSPEGSVSGVATLLIPDEATTLSWPLFVSPATRLLDF